MNNNYGVGKYGADRYGVGAPAVQAYPSYFIDNGTNGYDRPDLWSYGFNKKELR